MKIGIALAAVAVLCLAGMARADGAPKPEAQVGQIVSVEADGTVKVDTGDKVITVTTDEKTAVLIDGKTSGVDNLKKGMYATVTPARGTATNIVATTAKPGAKPRPAVAN